MALSKLQVSFLLCGLALLSCCFVNGKYTEAHVNYYTKICNATEEDANVIKSFNVPSTETGKRFVKCIDEDIGMLDSDGKYSKPKIFNVIKKFYFETAVETIEKINDVCYNETSKLTPAEWGTPDYHYKTWKCLNTQFKKNGMF